MFALPPLSCGRSDIDSQLFPLSPTTYTWTMSSLYITVVSCSGLRYRVIHWMPSSLQSTELKLGRDELLIYDGIENHLNSKDRQTGLHERGLENDKGEVRMRLPRHDGGDSVRHVFIDPAPRHSSISCLLLRCFPSRPLQGVPASLPAAHPNTLYTISLRKPVPSK